MKKFPFFAPFIVVLLILPYVSCKSAPATTPPARGSEPAAASKPLSPELRAAMSRAEEARKRASDFNSSAYFPSEWEAAEALYARAKQIPPDADTANHSAIAQNNAEPGVDEAITRYNDAANSNDAVAAYNAAADAYDSVFKLAIPLYAQAREDEIMALRNVLIAGGGRERFPEHLSISDKTALAALDQYKAEDYYAAKDTADQALALYQTLTTAYNAWLARLEIEERDFISYDPDNFERAGEILNDAMSAFGAEKFDLADQNANEALNRYNLVLSAGWAAHAERYAAQAAAARQAALDVKADVAVRVLFSEADAIYKTAVNAFDAEKYGDAARQFYTSEGKFVTAKESTLEKRGIAAQTIEEANRKIEESDETARLAELIIEGGAE